MTDEHDTRPRPEDGELAAALRAALLPVEEPDPPVRTELADVVARGRRRLRWQRLATASGVVAVAVLVAGVSFAASSLVDRPARTEAASSATPTGAPLTVTTPSSVGGGHPTAVPEPGWTTAPAPDPRLSSSGACVAQPAPGEGAVPPPLRAAVEQVFLSDLRQLDPRWKVAVARSAWSTNDSTRGGPFATVWADVVDQTGTRGVHLDMTTFLGPPATAAAATVRAFGNCLAPQRLMLSNGAVLQLYAPDDPPNAVASLHSQYLSVYTPGGHEYTVGDVNWGSPDLVAVSGEKAVYTVTTGRPTVALDQHELATLGLRLATVLP